MLERAIGVSHNPLILIFFSAEHPLNMLENALPGPTLPEIYTLPVISTVCSLVKFIKYCCIWAYSERLGSNCTTTFSNVEFGCSNATMGKSERSAGPISTSRNAEHHLKSHFELVFAGSDINPVSLMVSNADKESKCELHAISLPVKITFFSAVQPLKKDSSTDANLDVIETDVNAVHPANIFAGKEIIRFPDRETDCRVVLFSSESNESVLEPVANSIVRLCNCGK